MYVVADPDLLKLIMIKEFSSFVDRLPVSIKSFWLLNLTNSNHCSHLTITE